MLSAHSAGSRNAFGDPQLAAAERTSKSGSGTLSNDLTDVTKIVAAHRVDTLRNMDQIVVLDSGRIVEHGTFDALAARRGLFAALVNSEQRQGRGTHPAAEAE